MQVITSKDTEIEDLREELAETKKLEADLRDSRVCVCIVRHGGRLLASNNVSHGQGRDQPRARAYLHIHACAQIRRIWRRPRMTWRSPKR